MTIFKKHVFVCTSGSTCAEQGSQEVLSCLRKEIASLGLKDQIRINKAGCFNQCGNGPMVVVYPEAVWYAGVDPKDCQSIVERHLLNDVPIKRLLYKPKPQ